MVSIVTSSWLNRLRTFILKPVQHFDFSCFLSMLDFRLSILQEILTKMATYSRTVNPPSSSVIVVMLLNLETTWTIF